MNLISLVLYCIPKAQESNYNEKGILQILHLSQMMLTPLFIGCPEHLDLCCITKMAGFGRELSYDSIRKGRVQT
jgi:hypothetical protein